MSNTAKKTSRRGPQKHRAGLHFGSDAMGLEYTIERHPGGAASIYFSTLDHTYTGEKLTHFCEQLLRAASVALAGADQDCAQCFDDDGKECDIEIGVGDTVLVHMFDEGDASMTHEYSPGTAAAIAGAMLGGV